jgi:hypothetical protein
MLRLRVGADQTRKNSSVSEVGAFTPRSSVDLEINHMGSHSIMPTWGNPSKNSGLCILSHINARKVIHPDFEERPIGALPQTLSPLLLLTDLISTLSHSKPYPRV